LILIILATLMGWDWVWAVLFLFWAGSDLLAGETHLIEQVTRKQNPITYWLIVVTWIVLSGLILVPDSVWQSMSA